MERRGSWSRRTPRGLGGTWLRDGGRRSRGAAEGRVWGRAAATSRQAGRWALPPAQGRLVRTGQAGSQRHLCGEFGLSLPALAPGSASIGCKSVIKSRKPPQSPDPGGVGVSPFPWHHRAPSRCGTVHGHPSTHGCSPEPCALCPVRCQNFCPSSPADKALEKGGFFKI